MLSTRAPTAATSTALDPGGGSPAPGISTASTSRSSSSRRSCNVAWATSAASPSGPTATWTPSAAGCSSMSTPRTRAAPSVSLALLIIEARRRRQEEERSLHEKWVPAIPGPLSWLDLPIQPTGQGFVKVVSGVHPGEGHGMPRNWRARRGFWAQRRVSSANLVTPCMRNRVMTRLAMADQTCGPFPVLISDLSSFQITSRSQWVCSTRQWPRTWARRSCGVVSSGPRLVR